MFKVSERAPAHNRRRAIAEIAYHIADAKEWARSANEGALYAALDVAAAVLIAADGRSVTPETAPEGEP